MRRYFNECFVFSTGIAVTCHRYVCHNVTPWTITVLQIVSIVIVICSEHSTNYSCKVFEENPSKVLYIISI